MTEVWKEHALALLIGLLVVAGSCLVTYSGAQAQRVRDEVTAARQELCAALYATGTCTKITSGGKMRVQRGVIFEDRANPSFETLASLLKQMDWEPVDSGDPARTMFCRAGYAATYLLYEDHAWLDFSSDEPLCRTPSRA